MNHKELVDIAYKWACKYHGFAFKEFVTYANENPDVIAFKSYYSTLIECKASVQDFKADSHKRTRKNLDICMGNFKLYCMTKELYSKVTIPDGWGVLIAKENGKAKMIENVYQNRDKYYHQKNLARVLNENAMMYSALRRLNLRDRLKEIYDQTYSPVPVIK